jgi:hypothetical protein
MKSKILLGILVLFTVLPFFASAQGAPRGIYRYGPSMTLKLLQEKAYAGAGPLEILAYRPSVEAALAASPMIVEFLGQDLLSIAYDGATLNLQWRRKGSSLEVKNLKTGEYGELGVFNEDGSTLTITGQYILDRLK